MSRLDRLFATYRDRALAAPLTRANTLVLPALDLAGGLAIGLSVNR